VPEEFVSEYRYADSRCEVSDFPRRVIEAFDLLGCYRHFGTACRSHLQGYDFRYIKFS